MIEDRGATIEDRGATIEDRGATIEDRGVLIEIEDRGATIGAMIEDRDRGSRCCRIFVHNGVPYMLASLQLSGITVALTDWHNTFSVLSPISFTQQHRF